MQAFESGADSTFTDLRTRIAPRGEPGFVVWIGAERDNGNATLRGDIERFADAARQLARAADRANADATVHATVGRRLLGLLARYHQFIAARWPISSTTEATFSTTAATIIASLPASARAALAHASLATLATEITSDGRSIAPPATVARDNPYLRNVDAAIADRTWRAAIRAVQPATVKLGGGSGVNLAPGGLILTAGHVVDAVGTRLTVEFPDGTQYIGVTTHFDAALDLGVVELRGARNLPWARLASASPDAGDPVAIVGQPGTRTPDGDPTGYGRWHVSVGHIRGFRAGKRTGDQQLGRAKHDAWTYWGHSGSPLFDRRGAIVALHNSWDSTTAMRHAVTWEAIAAFLAQARLP